MTEYPLHRGSGGVSFTRSSASIPKRTTAEITAALIKNAPNQENAQKFIDFIVSKASEQKLIEGGFFDVSVRGGDGSFNVKGMTLNLKDIHQMLDVATKDMEEIFAAK